MFNTVTVIGAGRAGSAIAARLRERGVERARGRRAAPALRARPRDRRGRAVDRAGAVGRARLRRHAARRARPAHVAASRCIRCRRSRTSRGPEQLDGAWGARHRRGRRGRARARSGSPRRSACARSRSPTTGARSTTPARRSRRTSSSRSTASPSELVEAGRRAARGARAADGAHDRERLRADRPDRTRRLGDGRAAPRRPARAPVRASSTTPLAEATRAVIVVRTIAELDLPRHGVVGLVPTMGALHDGHAALFRGRAARLRRARRERCSSTRRSSRRRRSRAPTRATPSATRARAEAEGVDVLFAPPACRDVPARLRDVGRARRRGRRARVRASGRGHFRGVATVCLKLFNIVRPQIAWFGQKDAQQVAVVKQLVRDLNLPVEIRVVDTVRDPDGLALSSRNARSHADEREQALAIPRALCDPRRPSRARSVLAGAGLEPDYVEVADLDGPTLAIAARVGPTRLIDNVLSWKENTRDHAPPQARARHAGPREALAARARRDEAARRPHRDDHRLRRAVGPDRRRGRRRSDPRRRLRGDGDARPRLDGARDDRRDDHPDARGQPRRAAAARRRRPAVRLVPGLGRAGARERDPLRQGRRRRRREARRRRRSRSRACARSPTPAFP